MQPTSVIETANTRREATAVIGDAATTLMAMGFVIRERSMARLIANGPGWNSTKEPAMRAVSTVELDVDRGEVRLRAELGGLQRMRRRLILFPVALAVFFVVLIPTGILRHGGSEGVSRPAEFGDLWAIGCMFPLVWGLWIWLGRLARRAVAGFVASLAVG